MIFDRFFWASFIIVLFYFSNCSSGTVANDSEDTEKSELVKKLESIFYAEAFVSIQDKQFKVTIMELLKMVKH